VSDTLDKFGVRGDLVLQYFGVAFLFFATIVAPPRSAKSAPPRQTMPPAEPVSSSRSRSGARCSPSGSHSSR
jgi:hypothetical protein